MAVEPASSDERFGFANPIWEHARASELALVRTDDEGADQGAQEPQEPRTSVG